MLILVRRLRTWREMACDDVSVAGDHSARLAYSRFLVDLAETALGPRPATESASTLARRKCELMKRVTYQVREGAMTKVSKTKLSMILAVLVLAIGPLSLVYGEAPPAPAAAPQPAEAPAPAAEPTSVVEVAAPAAQPAQPDKPTKEEELKKKQALKAKGQHDVPPPPPKEALNLKVTPKGVLVAGQMVDDDHLKKILQTVATKKKDSAIIAIDSKGDVSMGDIHDLQRMLRDQDLTRVKYVGELGKAIAMNIPPAKMNKKLAEMPQDLVMRVKVDGQGVLMVDGKKTKGAKLSKVVSQALDTTPQLVVALATDRDTKYGAFVQVLDSLKQGGATRIAIQDPEG